MTGAVGATHSTERGSRSIGVQAELGMSPLQLVRGSLHRSWDAVVAATFARERDDNAWGVSAAAGPVFHPWGKLADMRTARLSSQVVGRWTTDARAAAVRIGVERAGFATGRDDGPRGGYALGEVAIGLYAEGAYVRPHEAERGHYVVTLGVTLRLPAMVGITCCASYR